MKRILKQIAKENNVSVSEVKREIEAAVRYAMLTPTPEAMDMRRRIGDDPSAEDIIKYLSGTVCGRI